MAYDAPEAATDDLAGKAVDSAPNLPGTAATAPPSLEQVESVKQPSAAPSSDPTLIPGAEADQIQLDGPNLKGEEGTGLTGGPIGN